jgi:hypothetical protein
LARVHQADEIRGAAPVLVDLQHNRRESTVLYQLLLIDAHTNAVEAFTRVDAEDRADALRQRPADWPLRRTRASSRGPWV